MIYYNYTDQYLTTERGAATGQKPTISYMEKPTWEIQLFDNTSEHNTIDFSRVASMRAAVDLDYNQNTVPMCRTLDDGIDKSRLAQGIVSVKLDAETVQFYEALNNRTSRSVNFELWGYDVNGVQCFYLIFAVTARMVIDPLGGDLPDVPDNFVDKTYADAVVRKKLIYEYSADGSEAHTVFVPHIDKFQRVRHGADGEPSDWQLIPYGQDGRVVEPDLVDDLAARPETAVEGFCFCSTEGDIYWFKNGRWTNPAHITTLTGPQGAPGKDGKDGRDGRDGSDGAKGDEGKQGPTGEKGDTGDGLAIDMTDIFARRHIYDASERGFKFLATDLLTDETDGRQYQCWYQKKSDELGDWSAGVRLYCGIQGPQGKQGGPGPQGPNGENAAVVPDYKFSELEVYGGSLVLDGTRPIAQVELYNAEGAGAVIPIAKEPGTPDCCAIRTCYDEGHTIVYFGTLDISLGGRVRFAQGIGGMSPYQEWLAEGNSGSYADWMAHYHAHGNLSTLQRLSVNSDGKLCLDGVAVCSCDGGGGTIDPPELATWWFYYGYIPAEVAGSNPGVSKVTKAMLDDDRSAIVKIRPQAIDKTSLGIVPAGALIVAFVPDGSGLTPERFNGVNGYVPFLENNPVAGIGANGVPVTIDGRAFAAYGEFNTVTAEVFIRALKTEAPGGSGELLYGYIPAEVAGDEPGVVKITKTMLDNPLSTVIKADAAAMDKTSFGTVPAGAVVFVLIPSGSGLKAERFNGINGYQAFLEDNPVAGIGANGRELTIGGADYLAYGEFALVTAEIAFRVIQE